LKIALIEVPSKPLPYVRWEDVYFPETPFPICEFMNHEQNQLRVWDLNLADSDFDTQRLIQELLAYQPVVIGINDHHTTNGLLLERLIKQVFPRALVFFSAAQMATDDLLDRANQNAFSLRHNTRPMAGKLRMWRDWEDEELFAVYADPSQRAQAAAWEVEYNARYHFDDFKQRLSASDYRKNLYMFELLETVLPADDPCWVQDTLRIFDSGAGSWTYAPAVYHFFRYGHTHSPRKVYFTGVELDPYRVDEDGYSQVDYALSYVDPIASHCRYLIQDVRDYTSHEPYDVALQMLPLVLPGAHLMWGLPARYYNPQALLHHVWNLLRPGATLVVSNEIEQEFVFQQSLFEAETITPFTHGAYRSGLRNGWMGFLSAAHKPL
jgi:SAM-dependent methyltransferase